ncbi:C1 family peptidase [Pediococcus claussenii]|uniref:Aminopeptidase n=1 Tax=Pediococcus claussenii (strain ATCC BAA-344 / DSM 14800 / JCM 18046 / KCTC 3811 / LMG 21948 / P06) TaxID=701521 RepID=G8PC93_PEDCP|nr:C1 family peptidase [Pediococcus claussenii]AEV96071.1 aminopeptidase E [Pediococcus claussenii ATCC BAA-344]ANZ69555.1 aminopeptidase [Pediococcus claussenii]ANZ71372.1 aminopeptidase [Pediococcus claussenii]KRN19405.1 pepE protein [Pediococcus claussenii]
MGLEIDSDLINALQLDLENHKEVDVLRRAVTKNGVNAVSENNEVLSKLNRTFSVEVETGKVTNQLHSGRCWMFSLLNTLRHTFAKKYNVKDFELSQSYIYFWDKIERANIFYDRIIKLANQNPLERELQLYLSMPGEDGGQWAMAAALVQKYGVVPISVMPETFNTKDTTGFADALNLKLRRDAIQLRELKNDGATDDELQNKRDELLKEVYRMTSIAVGEPPVKFDLEYRDDDKEYHVDRGLTPQEFYQKYIGTDLDDYVVLTNSPDKPYNKLYSLPSQDNVIGGKPITFLNVDMEYLKKAAIQQLKDGETVWFGNDVLKQMSRTEGILDSELFKKDELFGVDLSMSKAERFKFGEAEVSHAMTLTGVDLIDDRPTKWKVENSWGDKNGKDGYFAMGDNWFEDFVYEVVVHRQYLTEEQLKVNDGVPEPLSAWDPLR